MYSKMVCSWDFELSKHKSFREFYKYVKNKHVQLSKRKYMRESWIEKREYIWINNLKHSKIL